MTNHVAYEHDQIFAKSKDDEISTKTVSMDTIFFLRVTDSAGCG